MKSQNSGVDNRSNSSGSIPPDVESPERDHEWLHGGGGSTQAYYSALEIINRDNVRSLGFAWQYEVDTTHGFEATPIMSGGVLFSSGPKGAVYAVDARTGRELWNFEPLIDVSVLRKVCCGLVNRGVAIADESVFVGSVDGHLYALRQDDGSVRWRVDTITDRQRGYTITGAPYIANDLVIIGNSGAELDARGYVSAYRISTGKLAWRFFTVPGTPDDPFEHSELEWASKTWDPKSLWEVGLGGTVWDGMVYDEELNLLYVGTGNAAPYPRKLRSPSGGDNLFLSSILAINPEDGKLVWHYQTTPSDNWDFTSTQKMILADIEIRGELRKVMMQAPKNGFFYVIDRVSGELISAEPYVAVNWAFGVDLNSGRPLETGQGEYYSSPKLVFPGPQGGHNWQPMSYNEETGLVYLPAIEAGAIWSMPDTPFVYAPGGLNTGSVYLWPMSGVMGLDDERAAALPNFEILAEGQPDPTIRGFLRAWDPVAQELVWEVDTSDQWVGDIFATWNGGGVMSTAAGLVFQGRATGELIVYDAKTGDQLKTIDVGTSIMAAPMTYSLAGEQYVVVMAGLGGALGQHHPPGTAAYKYGNKGRMLAFKLGGGEVPKRPRKALSKNIYPKPPVDRPNDISKVRQGRGLFERHCSKCHTNIDGAGIPNLKRMSADTHQEFYRILLEGTRESRGMGNFSDLLDRKQVESIYSYLIEQAWREYHADGRALKYHQVSESTEQ